MRQIRPTDATPRAQLLSACQPGACNRHGLRRFGALSWQEESRPSASRDSIPNPRDLRGYLMSKALAALLICTCLFTGTALAQPTVRKFDDPGSPPFKMLKTGENQPLD